MDDSKKLRVLCEEYESLQKEILCKTETRITTLVANQYNAGVIQEAMDLRRVIQKERGKAVGVEKKPARQ